MIKLASISVIISSLLLTTQVHGQTSSLSKVKREMNIMSNILQASFKEDKQVSIRNIDTQYLKGQGATFTLTSRSLSQHSFSDLFAGFEEFAFNDGNVFFDHENYQKLGEEAHQRAMEAIQISAEKIKELAEKERDLAYDIRTIEREKRDLNFERRHSDKTTEAELEKRIKQLESEVEKLENKRSELDKEKNNTKQQLKQKANAKKKEVVEKHKQSIRTSVQLISNTLCDYGAGLKSIENSQFVNFVFKNGAGSKQDVVLVFSKKDINKCVTGKIDAAKLLSNVTQYTF